MRHDYERVDPDTLWEILTEKLLSTLKVGITELFSDRRPDDEGRVTNDE